jgi:hypothetical protein
MKKMRIVGLLLATLVVAGARGQDIENLIKGSTADANYLVKGYTAPFITAFGSGLNQGWYNTAAPHKFPGADLTFSVSLISVPSSGKEFMVDNSKMTEIQLDGGSGKVPTIFGSDNATGKQYSLVQDNSQKFDVPGGVGFPLPKVPVPIANLGIGLPKGFDIKIRYVPTIPLGGDLELGMFGIGVMHDIKQWIPGVKNLPFSLSAFAGYTKFKTTVTLDKAAGQTSEFDISATTIQALISKKLAILTVYAGVGFDISKGSIGVLGTYDLDGTAGNNSVTNPIDFSVSNSSPRATIGARLKLGPLTFHGDYTARKYSAITAGVGLSIR